MALYDTLNDIGKQRLRSASHLQLIVGLSRHRSLHSSIRSSLMVPTVWNSPRSMTVLTGFDDFFLRSTSVHSTLEISITLVTLMLPRPCCARQNVDHQVGGLHFGGTNQCRPCRRPHNMLLMSTSAMYSLTYRRTGHGHPVTRRP